MRFSLSHVVVAYGWMALAGCGAVPAGSLLPDSGVPIVETPPATTQLPAAGIDPNTASTGPVASPNTPTAHEPPRGAQIVTQTAAGLCLDVVGGSLLGGTPVQAAPCTDAKNQQWVLQNGQVVVYGGMCLDMPTGQTPSTASSPVIQPCQAAAPYQQWAFYNNTLRVLGTVQCIWLPNQEAGSDSNLVMTQCQDDNSVDRWSVNGSGGMALSPTGAAQLCLGALNGQIADGAPVVLQACDGSVVQAWQFVSNTLMLGTKCLDLPSDNTRDGTLMQLWDCNGNSAQNWFVQGGMLRNGTDFGKCLGQTASGAVAGARIEVDDCGDAPGMQWVVQAP